MAKKKIDYSKTVIYKIVCNDLNIKDVYVGGTTDFRHRKQAHKNVCENINHKKHNMKVYKMINENGCWSNWSMIEIEKFPCSDGNESRSRERYWYEQLNASLNTIRPIITDDEARLKRI